MDFHLSLDSERAASAYPETPVAVSPETSVGDVVRLLQASRAAAALVCDSQERLVGVFTERDALRLIATGAGPGAVDFATPITQFMSRDPVTVDSKSTVGDAIRRMSEGGYRHLPLVDAADPTKPIGVIGVRGLLRYLVEHFPNTIYNLPPSSQRAPSRAEGA